MLEAVTFDWWFTITNMPVQSDEFARWAKDYRLKGMDDILREAGMDISPEKLSDAYEMLSGHLKDVWDRDMDLSGEEQIALFLQYAGAGRMADGGLIARLGVPFSNAVLDRPPALNPGVVDCLSTLKRDGYKIGVISNTGRTWGRALIGLQKKYGIQDFFDVLSFSDEIGVRKPHPAIFKKTLEGLKLPAEKVLHVGDNVLDDVSGAKSVGMRAVWYNTGIWPGAKTDQADAEIHHFSELPAIVRRL
jgi:HAD superfamily hydrolase (TIGR01509 family)